MSRVVVSALSGLLALGLAGQGRAEPPSVVADIAPVHALVARVMEGVARPELIVAPGASPHAYSLRPSEAAALQGADVLVWIGPDLTPWMESAVGSLSSDAVRLSLLDHPETARLPVRTGALFEAHVHDEDGEHRHEDHDDHGHNDHAHDEHGHDDHAHDEHGHDDHAHDEHGHDDHAHDEHGHDDHAHDEHAHDDHGHDEHAREAEGHEGHDHAEGGTDPHAWLSPANASAWLGVIAETLAARDPDNAARYRANAEAGQADLAALTEEIAALLEPVRDRPFIVFHDGYQYFETAFDVTAAGAISVSDAVAPSPARVAEIRARVAAQGIVCVLSEPQFSPGLVAAVMEGSGVQTGVIDPLGADLEPGSGLYAEVLRRMSGALAGCLGTG